MPERVQRERGRYYRVRGSEYPSVTTVLNVFDPKQEAIEAWKRRTPNFERVRDRAAIRGTFAHHRILNRYAMRPLPLPKVDMSLVDEELEAEVETCVALWEQLDFDVGASPHIEEPVWNARAGYAGTLDMLTDGTVVDLKTSKAAFDSHKLQIAAYWKACHLLTSMPDPVDAAIIVLNPDPKTNPRMTGDVVRLDEDALEEHYETFLSVLSKFR